MRQLRWWRAAVMLASSGDPPPPPRVQQRAGRDAWRWGGLSTLSGAVLLTPSTLPVGDYSLAKSVYDSENRIRAAHDPCGASMRARRFLDAESSLSLSYAFKGRYQASSSWLLRIRGAHSERRLLRAQPPPACHPAVRRTQGSRVPPPVLVYVAGV